MPLQTWMPADDAALERLWRQGLTTREIGERMGKSKNAVIGRAHRLHLDSRPDPIKRKDWTPLSKEERKARRHSRWKRYYDKKHDEILEKGRERYAKRNQKPANIIPLRRRRTMNDYSKMPLSPTATCQHIKGDPRVDPSKCAQPAVVGKPYCPEHCADCYIVHTPKVQREAA